MSEEVKEIISNEKSSLSVLLDTSRVIQSKCSDYNVSKANHSNFRFNDFAGVTYIPDNSDIRQPLISNYALGQLCNKVGVPAQYIKRCCDSGMIDLAQTNLNTWIDEFNKDLFIREYNGSIRGVLSSKYSTCDSPQILEVLNDTVDLKGYTVKGSFVNEERLHLRLVDKNHQLKVFGEDLYPGIVIDSSDVGRSILTCSFFVFKQVCTNGMVINRAGGTLFKQKHIGIDANEFREGLVASIQNIKVLSENVEELIKASTNEISPVGNFKTSIMSQEELEKLVDTIKMRTKLSDEGSKKVIELMDVRYGNSKWGYINAITEVAQDYTLERRIELEKYAGDLLAS